MNRAMTTEQIVEAITDTVRRYASLKGPVTPDEIKPNVRPYYDLGMSSLHDLNIACEVQAILGVELPPEQKLLFQGNRALSIREAAENIARHVSQSPAPSHA